ncbi:hypothetical protein BGL48_01685 [Salinivibrio sp. SS3]|uniref:tellurite resistance TerB family protein n=1 Tax=Salinivibrio sp. SS3 TaxID=1895021 RepID=UPI0008481DB4|nr:TerB family tellurite resistance protein [Salinivibrio sp. BNH]ODP97152.1 hypothetical protein BGL48_01685 [Salinivibrio sp. BNH]
MMDILDVIDEATKEANSFENHAAKDLPLEERLLYLQGLALVMNADGDIHPEEREYIRILIKSFEMDESILEEFVEFANRPEKDTVQAFFRTFRRRPVAQLFLFDALMLTRRDDAVDEKEKVVVDKIAEQLEILKGAQQDIFDLFCHIKNKDWEDSSLYFTSHLLNPEHFNHLLDYYEVNLDEIVNKVDELRRKKFMSILKNRLNERIDVDDPKIDIPNELLIPLFQSSIDRGDNKIIDNKINLLDVDCELSELGLAYDQEYKYIYIVEDANVTNSIVLKYFGQQIGLTPEDTYSFFYNKPNGLIFASIGPKYRAELSKPYEEGMCIIMDDVLWKYKRGRDFNIIGNTTIYCDGRYFSTGKYRGDTLFDEGQDRIKLRFNDEDMDEKGILYRVQIL